MALSQSVRRKLSYMLGSTGYADQLADIIDAGSGTVGDGCIAALRNGMANKKAADLLVTAAEASSALNGYTIRHLGYGLGSMAAAQEIAAELAAE